MTFALRYAVRSDVGLLREGNEDSAYAGPHLLAVADGMGGYEAGEVASASVIKSVAPLDRMTMPESELIDAIAEAVTTAKQNLRGIVEADPAVGSMGTTLTAMLWSGPTAAICHIGDSRAYLLRAGDLYQITRDHTFVQALIDQGRIRPDEAATHPQRSLLLRALDGRTDADPDLSLLTAETGDRFLLCSDGLPVAVNDEQILETLAEIADPAQVVRQLIDLAIRGGGPDNITCIVADVIDTDRGQYLPTTAPAVAGAVASVGNQETKSFSRPSLGADDDVSRMMSSPGRASAPPTGTTRADGSSWPAAPGVDTAARPDTRAPARSAAPVAEAGDYRRRRRRRGWPVMTTLVVLFVLLIGGGLVVGYQIVRSQYYVGSDNGKVAIFRGMNDKILGISLNSVYQTTNIPVSGITAASAEELRQADTGSLAMAQQFLANIRKQYQTCQAAHAAVRKWIAGKPKPVKITKRIDGHKVTRTITPKYRPEPTIPSFCPQSK
ncbi:MAG TPA: protein phosphatase 2C domain-containing protein [Streptosporangiaceae bacterium]|nr:protein phosphatase 2C domain-containing protein [Streptosporangiaceae bacterium]